MTAKRRRARLVAWWGIPRRLLDGGGEDGPTVGRVHQRRSTKEGAARFLSEVQG